MAVGPRNKNSGSVSSSDAVHMTVIRQERTRCTEFSCGRNIESEVAFLRRAGREFHTVAAAVWKERSSSVE